MNEELNSNGTSDDLTRRQWLLRLGEMVALVGVSGLVPDAALLQSGAPVAVALPPGLYDPSEEHLVHALATAKFAPPPGCETDYIDLKVPYRLQFFSSDEFREITRFVEILLGNVDRDALVQSTRWLDLYLYASAGVREAAQHLDPLHRILAVQFYGEDAVRELETFDPAKIVRLGLKSLHELSMAQQGKPFLELAPAEQVQIVESTSAAASDSAKKRFFEVMRRESMHGYYTSAKGLEDLDYQGNAFYTECPGCEPKS